LNKLNAERPPIGYIKVEHFNVPTQQQVAAGPVMTGGMQQPTISIQQQFHQMDTEGQAFRHLLHKSHSLTNLFGAKPNLQQNLFAKA